MKYQIHPIGSDRFRAAKITALLAVLLTVGGLSWPAQTAQAAVVPNAITSISTTSTVGEQWSQVNFDCQWAVPDGSKPGDTFTLQLPSQLRWFGASDFDLKTPSGEAVATARASDSGLVVFTLTDFVAAHPKNIGGTCNFTTRYVQELTTGGTELLEFPVGSNVVRVPVNVGPCTHDCIPKPPLTPAKRMWWADSAQTELYSDFRLPATTLASSDITITDTPGPGTELDCSRVVPRVGKTLDRNGNIASPSDEAVYPAVVACTSSQLTVSWKALPKGELAQLSVITKVTDRNRDSYTNAGRVTIAGQDTPVTVETRRTTAGGTGNGSTLPPSPSPSTASPTPTPKPSTAPATPSATSTPTASTPAASAPPATTPAASPSQPSATTPTSSKATPVPLANTGAGGMFVVPLAVLLVAVGAAFAWLGARKAAKRRAH